MVTRLTFVGAMLAAACSGKPGGGPAGAQAPAGQSGSGDRCTTAVDKVFALMVSEGRPADPGLRDGAVEECRKTPDDPTIACVVAATDEAGVKACMNPKPKGEPLDQLAAMTENLRTYFFVHETFTSQQVGLTPGRPCCQYPTKKCPPEAAPNEILTGILMLDLSKEREFQYRFESSGDKAVIEAVGDRDCDGKTITYRRELEHRADGNMHITVLDPPAGSD
jgi:hypothetical protein